MECSSCRTENRPGDRFCTGCGRALAVVCAACDHSNPPGARFCGGCGAALGAPRSAAAAAPAPAQAVERRQLTVMFCDLVGSTPLAARLDPEDLRDVIRSFHHCCAGVIAQHGGFLARYMGDGVLAFFGFPHAHDDDAVEAVRAGLAVVEEVAKLDDGVGDKLRVRIGIATGLVVVGDHIGGALIPEQEVAGETPHLAARLQSVAEPGQVLISSDTRRLAGRYFDYRELGAVPLKGFNEPVPAWQVLRASAVASRFEARQVARMLPLVGREEELDLLLARWREASRGDGRLVVLTGEPGIGKSRLTAALQDRIRAEPHIRLRYFCSPHHADSAWFPVIGQLERACGFEHGDTPDRKLAKLESMIERSGADLARDGPLLADLLSLPTTGRYQLPDMVPQQRKERTMAALIAQLHGLAARQPVLMIFEDAHWSDPTSLEALRRTIDGLPQIRMLLVVTARPEFVAPWFEGAHATVMPLRRLTPEDAVTVIGQIAGGRSMPEEVVSQILARTEGVPLFVEELTKTVLESGDLRERDGRYELAGLLPSGLAIPPTVQESIMARLDRLAPVKEVAHVGAALGRSFSHRMLQAVAHHPEGGLLAALTRLLEAEIIFQHGVPPEAIYTFKHALVQDAAYGSMLRSARQALHRRVVHAIESQFRELLDTEPELIAEHCARAELREQAVDYWAKAGERAVARSANREAINHLRKGLALLEQLPAGVERMGRELRLQLTLGHACIAVYGYAGEDTSRAYARAGELIDVGDLHQRMGVLFGVYTGRLIGGRLDAAAEPVRQMFELVQDGSDLGYSCLVYRVDGVVALYRGELVRARAHLQKAIELYDEPQHGHLAYRFGSDLGISAQAWLVVTLWLLGRPDAARLLADATAAAARTCGHVHTIGHVLGLVTHVYSETRDFQTLDRIAAEGVHYCAQNGLGFFGAWLRVMQVWSAAQLGAPADHLDAMTAALDSYAATGAMLMRPYFRGLLAQLQLAAGKADAAEAALDTALSDAAATGEHWWEAEIHRLRGACCVARARPNVQAAERCFRQAIAEARMREARMLELRAAVSLAELMMRGGRSAEARALLDPIYRSFTEGLATPDLRTARALLGRVSSAA